MNKITLFVAAVAMAALPVSAYAAAANVNTNVTAAANVNVLTGKSTFADVTGSLTTSTTANAQTSGNGATDFTKITASSKFTIVKVSKLKGYSAAALKLNATGKKNMVSLDAKVAANAALSAALKKAGYTASDVLAVSSDMSGNVTVFVAK
jgi:hypothetical protein